MHAWQIVALSLYGVVVAIAALRHLLFTYGIRQLTFLTPRSPRSSAPASPKVTILVPAKDEAHGIEACVRSLLQQDYPNFELLVIDDRSTDDTAAIVERVSKEDARLKLLRVQSLPAGWTGKTHALHLGQQQATGDWLLFVDADTQLEPSCLAVILTDAIDHSVDMESLLPALEARTFWERVIQPFAGVCLMFFFPLTKVNDAASKDMGFANGQFILVRRPAYDAIGGHEGVKDKFVEDVHLGRKTRQQGLGLRVVLAPELVRVRMYSSLTAIVRGWSRIYYSAVDFKPARLYVLFASVMIFSVLSYAILIIGGSAWLAGVHSPFLKWLLILGVAHQFFATTLMARVYALSHSRLEYLLFRIIAVFVTLYIILVTVRMCRTHQVIWRGTTYGKDMQA